METKTIQYQAGETTCEGFLVYSEKSTANPVVLIAPTWQGLNRFAKEKAEEIALLGYSAFAIDLYGNGKAAANNEEAANLMLPLFLNRSLLSERMQAAFAQVVQFPNSDPSRVGVLGFCFGGLCALELFKSGANLRATVSCHGVLGDKFLGATAKLAPLSSSLNGSVLILHGAKDPLVPVEDLLALQQQLKNAGVDWQTVIYGNVGHSFTNPEATDEKSGLYFNPTANRRSFQVIQNFFKERFNESL